MPSSTARSSDSGSTSASSTRRTLAGSPRLHDLRHTFAVHRPRRLVPRRRGRASPPPLAGDLPRPCRSGRHAGLSHHDPRTAGRGFVALPTLRRARRAWRPTMNPSHPIGPFVRRFLVEEVAAERGLSPNTQKSYRDTIRLLLRFLAERHGTDPTRVTVEQVDATLLREFLRDLKDRRKSSAATRNQRLTACARCSASPDGSCPNSWTTPRRSKPFRPAARRFPFCPIWRKPRSRPCSPCRIAAACKAAGTALSCSCCTTQGPGPARPPACGSRI